MQQKVEFPISALWFPLCLCAFVVSAVLWSFYFVPMHTSTVSLLANGPSRLHVATTSLPP